MNDQNTAKIEGDPETIKMFARLLEVLAEVELSEDYGTSTVVATFKFDHEYGDCTMLVEVVERTDNPPGPEPGILAN